MVTKEQKQAIADYVIKTKADLKDARERAEQQEIGFAEGQLEATIITLLTLGLAPHEVEEITKIRHHEWWWEDLDKQDK